MKEERFLLQNTKERKEEDYPRGTITYGGNRKEARHNVNYPPVVDIESEVEKDELIIKVKSLTVGRESLSETPKIK